MRPAFMIVALISVSACDRIELSSRQRDQVKEIADDVSDEREAKLVSLQVRIDALSERQDRLLTAIKATNRANDAVYKEVDFVLKREGDLEKAYTNHLHGLHGLN